MPPQPVILLTFSNSPDDYLPMIVEEQKAIKNSLLDYVDNHYLQIRDVQHASAVDIFYLINRYHNQVQILHYGGHADGESLQLEQEVGVIQMAKAKGLAGLLGTQEELKLVFLNGCATKGQVKSLLDAGVQAVLATSVPVNDSQALQFSKQFYQALSAGSTLREAFLKARAYLETQSDPPPFSNIEESRGLQLRESTQNIPWGLYWKPEAQSILDWKLPTTSTLEINFATDSTASLAQTAVNNLLVDSTLKAIRESAFVKELARKIHQERKAGYAKRLPSDAEKKDALVRSYLAPISVHLRALFSNNLARKYDEERLAQMVTTYRITLEFICFIMLSDIWDAVHKKRKPLKISASARRQLEAFFGLHAKAKAGFDFFQLADALLMIANHNQIQFYTKRLNHYPEGFNGVQELVEGNRHFQEMRTALEGDIPSRLIEPFGQRSEKHLTNLLCELNYLIHYKMAVVKNIEVLQIKNMPPPSYKHTVVELDNNYNDFGEKDRQQELEKPTDMESVLLYQDLLKDNLNLSPFILDENALTREFNSKIYFFSHVSEKGLEYYWIENEQDRLTINGDNYDYVFQQFQQARMDILNERSIDGPDTDKVDEDDILSLM